MRREVGSSSTKDLPESVFFVVAVGALNAADVVSVGTGFEVRSVPGVLPAGEADMQEDRGHDAQGEDTGDWCHCDQVVVDLRT